jgi:hypothetical protein
MALESQRELRDLLSGLAEARGRGRSANVEPTFARRYECKYLIEPLLTNEVRDFLKPFVQPDAFAARRPDHRYPVGSLYLDSPDLLLFRQTQAGEKDRFKLRVRTYSDDPDQAAYFEVKRKINSVVHKCRARLTREQARAVLSGPSAPVLTDLPDRRQRDLDDFLVRVARIDARPVVRVKYLREAYQATGREPVRVTIDTDLEHAVTLGSDLAHGSGAWIRTPLDGTILEIKFTERYPGWLEDLVRSFGLRQRPVPKYILSLEHALANGQRSRLVRAGFEPFPTWS